MYGKQAIACGWRRGYLKLRNFENTRQAHFVEMASRRFKFTSQCIGGSEAKVSPREARGCRENFQTYTYDEGGGVPARRRRRKFDLKAPFTALPLATAGLHTHISQSTCMPRSHAARWHFGADVVHDDQNTKGPNNFPQIWHAYRISPWPLRLELDAHP